MKNRTLFFLNLVNSILFFIIFFSPFVLMPSVFRNWHFENNMNHLSLIIFIVYSLFLLKFSLYNKRKKRLLISAVFCFLIFSFLLMNIPFFILFQLLFHSYILICQHSIMKEIKDDKIDYQYDIHLTYIIELVILSVLTNIFYATSFTIN